LIGRHRFSRDRHGRFRTGLGAAERELLKVLPSQAQSLLESHDESTRRVFPVAYPGDERAEDDYRQMMGTHLLDRHRQSLETLASSVDAPTVDEEELHQWLDALEVLRLVLGTQLDVGEDPLTFDENDPLAPQYAVYGYLSALQGEIIDSLSESLPDEGRAVEDEL
jgi:hypothetical protein